MTALKRLIKRTISRKKRDFPTGIFCYHKVGTVLLSKVFRSICSVNGWTFEVLHGMQTRFPKNVDVAVFSHSLVDPSVIRPPLLGVHVIRDPRDVIVSGYQYHCRTTEQWCTNTDFSVTPPILYPQVPYSQQHRSEVWKAEYLKSLRNKSYQQNLLDRSQNDGLAFEINHYGTWTIESMEEWDYTHDNILELRFEKLMGEYTDTFRLIFHHLQFSDEEINQYLDLAASHNLKKKSSNEIKKMRHVTSLKTSRWREYLDPEHKDAIRSRFSSALLTLGYETDNDW
ncbi:MAG: sulfotransferase domain-containing protein [Planctomycetota bacterium]